VAQCGRLLKKNQIDIIENMLGLVWTKSQPLLAVHLIIAVLAAFIFALAAPVHSYEFEIMGKGSDTYYASPVTIIECLAVVPKISETNVKNNFSPLRLASLRLFIFLGIYNIILAFLKSSFMGSVHLYPLNIKNSISLKLRI
jgi:hypothetical protein